jgi:hypothetical protein
MHSPTNAQAQQLGEGRRVRASTAYRACWARASVVGSGSGPAGSEASMEVSGSESSKDNKCRRQAPHAIFRCLGHVCPYRRSS